MDIKIKKLIEQKFDYVTSDVVRMGRVNLDSLNEFFPYVHALRDVGLITPKEFTLLLIDHHVWLSEQHDKQGGFWNETRRCYVIDTPLRDPRELRDEFLANMEA